MNNHVHIHSHTVGGLFQGTFLEVRLPDQRENLMQLQDNAKSPPFCILTSSEYVSPLNFASRVYYQAFQILPI